VVKVADSCNASSSTDQSTDSIADLLLSSKHVFSKLTKRFFQITEPGLFVLLGLTCRGRGGGGGGGGGGGEVQTLTYTHTVHRVSDQ